MSDAFNMKRSAEGIEAVLRICGSRGRILLLMQDNPDPDSIASAAALRDLIYSGLHRRAVIGYGGRCGRAENRAMLDVLRIDAHRIVPHHLAGFSTVCVVDTQPGSGNNVLRNARVADIVIDHHPTPKRHVWVAKWADIRPGYGATSTVLYEYCLAAAHKLSPGLATALYYGIQSDTQDLGREVNPADTAAYLALFPQVDRKKLRRIRRAAVPAEYFQMVHRSLSNCVVAGTTVISTIPSCSNPDMVSEIADLMLRLSGIRISVCYGLCGDTIHLSARAVDARSNVLPRIRRVVSRLGTGGGHRTMAGGQVPVEDDPEKRMRLVRERLLTVFAAHQEPRPLLSAKTPVPHDVADESGEDAP